MSNLLSFVRKNWIIFLILIIGLFLRVYKPLGLFMYSHDQDLAGWIIKDILVNKHLRLIGQETTSQGVFTGPLFYYLQIPFYLLTKMDPAGAILLVTLLGMLAIFSFYFCFSKMFDKKAGLIAAFIYSVSLYFVFTDREVVPTTPVHLWTVWFLFSLWMILKGKSKAYLLIGFLAGIIWNFNLALAIVIPLVLVVQVCSKIRINLKSIAGGIAVFFIMMSPFFIFEVKHSFRQTKAIASSLVSPKDYVSGTGRGLAKLDRVFQLVYKNVSSIFWGGLKPIPGSYTFFFLVISFILLMTKRIISRRLGLIMALWAIVYIAFFTVNAINISEYYFNGMNVIWIAIVASGLSFLLRKNIYLKRLAISLLVLLAVLNFYGLFTKAINRSGYLERKALVGFIDQDSKIHDYPCVSVSYITSPGNDLGYRYLFWLKGMHVNQSISGSPVYTIVFPHSKVDRIDKSFGALGLVLPDYERYNKREVEISCSGENSNLTDPMFGFTN